MTATFGLLLNFFVAIIAILNPVGNVPFFIDNVADEERRVRRAIAVLLSLAIFILMAVFFLLGESLLNAFGITIPAFRIAGGILILLMGIKMIKGKPKTAVEGITIDKPQAKDPYNQAARKLSSFLVPVGIPLFVGPGTITTVILYSDRTHGIFNKTLMLLPILSASLIVLACLLASDWIKKILGNNGLQIVVRIMGLILCAIAIQFVIDGFAQITTGIINPEFTKAH